MFLFARKALPGQRVSSKDIFSSNTDHKAGTTQELCAITGLTAQYRDPQTGLPYANSYAYAELQKLRNGGSRWSTLLGCYVGPMTTPAGGVPDEFRGKRETKA